MRMLALIPAAGAMLALSVGLAAAAGPYDGTWEISAPQAKGVANAANPQGCEPVMFQLKIKDNQVSGKLAFAALGRARVESDSSRSTPITGHVEPDGTLNAQWQNYNAVGKLSGDTGEVRWSGQCGPRVASGKRISK